MTIKELAKIAGLSHSTVSRSLNDSPLIAEKTKRRVKKLAEEYNFELNANARSLITSKTGTIGIIFPVHDDKYRSIQYLGSLMDSLRLRIEEEQYDTIITCPKNPRTNKSNIIKLVKQKKVDGIILVVHQIEKEDWEILMESMIPFVSLHYKWNDELQDKINYVCSDNFKGGYMAAECLLKAGRRKLLCLSSGDGGFEFSERVRGFSRALADWDMEVNESCFHDFGLSCFEVGYNFVMENRTRLSEIDGISAHADTVALGVIEAMKELGIRVPDDIAVVGYDDLDITNFFHPRLTTIHQRKEEQVEMGCCKLMNLISGEETSEKMQVAFEPTLCVRETCIV